MRMCLIIGCMLLPALAACGLNARKYPPPYEIPATRVQAARVLHTALMQGAPEMFDIAVTADILRWDEILRPLSHVEPSPRVILRRELRFDALRAVARPLWQDGLWRITLDAAGGEVTLTFNNADACGRAEAALRRLAGC